MRVLVTGAAGHLGAAIVQGFTRPSGTPGTSGTLRTYNVTALSRAELDIADDRAVRDAVARIAPDVIVNCAAYNDVDGAEDDPVRAFKVNAFAVQALAREAAARRAALVHYGSDFVFDGRSDRPYTEEDRPNPGGVYALSKLLGEWLARDAGRCYVLRVESIFAGPTAGTSARLGSAGRIVAAIQAGEEVPVFTDRVVSPSHAGDVAAATRQLLERGAEPGLYHCVNAGQCRWDEFAREAARLMKREARLRPITLDSANLRAQRPRYSALSTAKLAHAGIVMPSWQDALMRYVAAIRLHT
jgi:dTDP-4-dehydrorhamnose reductase